MEGLLDTLGQNKHLRVDASFDFSVMLEIEPRALYMLGKFSTTKMPPYFRLQLGRAWSQQGACFSLFHSWLLCHSQGLSLPSYRHRDDKDFSLLQCGGTACHALEHARNVFLSVSLSELLFNTQLKYHFLSNIFPVPPGSNFLEFVTVCIFQPTSATVTSSRKDLYSYLFIHLFRGSITQWLRHKQSSEITWDWRLVPHYITYNECLHLFKTYVSCL